MIRWEELQSRANEGEEVLPPMAKSQENGNTILLGLKGYAAGKVIEVDIPSPRVWNLCVPTQD